jgi:LmbE family N-acetylglucosaminyl deacetylase
MNLVARAVALGALVLALAGLPGVAAAKSILFIAPHPDDETLVSGGRIREAVLAGDSVKVIVFTNGDIGGVESGLQRQGESVAAAQLLGLTEQDVIFLGYPDAALMDIYRAPSPTDVITSAAGRTSTYGSRGLGGMDYHSLRFGSPGPYNRVTVEQDLRTILSEYRPDEIYTVTHFDSHPDHQVTALFVTDALVALKQSGSALAAKLYQGLVWPPSHNNAGWPGSEGCAPSTPFPEPQMENQLEWKRTLRSVVLANLKCQAILEYRTQATPHLLSFARKDEFFWLSDFGVNLAVSAEVTVSSENSAGNQGRMKAVDGVADGAQRDPSREWVTSGELSAAWIQFAWPSPVVVAQVNLQDRPRGSDNVIAGTLSFSDGTSISVGALPWDGKVLPVTFAPKTVSWVRFTIDQAEGSATGLSEIQVLGVQAAQAGENVAPHFLEGPSSDASAIRSSESAKLSVLGHDLNGDAVQYNWSADGGTINGDGANAVFTPPAVTESTVFTISAQLLDGRGGSASNVTFVTVTPGDSALSVSPAAVVGGQGAQGTVTLASAAPAGGLSVPLSSSNPAAAQVPANVTVPAGALTASFPVSTSNVGASTTLTLSATIDGATRTATLVVSPSPASAIAALALSASSVTGGASATGTVTLNGPAPSGGAQVTLSSNSPAAAVPASATVAAGATSATFSVTTSAVAASTPVTISASHGGATQSASLTVMPAVVSSLSVSPASLTGGNAAAGTVTLSGPAPAGGAQVALSSNNPAAALPASVTVAAGATSAGFSVTTSPVATSTAVTISGSYAGATQTASLTVVPPGVAALSLSTPSVTGGTSAAGMVTLDGPAPAGGAQVALSSSTGAAQVPSSVTVAAGATATSFVVTTSPVAVSTAAAIAASSGGRTQSVTLTVLPPVVSALNVSPASVMGGSPATGTVTLNAPAPAGGAQVALSSDSGAASVPSSVTVPAGATSASFSFGTSAVANNTAVTLSASYGGATRIASLTVLHAVLTSLTLNPTSVIGLLGSSTATVTLNGPAPAGGAVVTLSDNSGACSTPGSVTIPANATSATFTVRTSLVLITTTCTITATYKGTSRSANLQVTL